MTIDDYLDPMTPDELRGVLYASASWWGANADNPQRFASANLFSALGREAMRLLVDRKVATEEELLKDIAGFGVEIDRLAKALREPPEDIY